MDVYIKKNTYYNSVVNRIIFLILYLHTGNLSTKKDEIKQKKPISNLHRIADNEIAICINQ